MKRLLMILGSWSFVAVMAVAADPKEDLWIVSGQSNACGRAKLPGPDPDSRVRIYQLDNDQFVTAQDPLPGMNTKGMGPWVAAGQNVAKQGIDVRLVGYAMGGRPIAFWHPGQPGDQGLFPRIAKAGQKASAFLWYQGESDAQSGMSRATYLKELQQLVARVRKEANNPSLVAVIVQLGPCTSPGVSGYTSTREAQRQFVAGDAHAVLVPALGRTLGDAVHMDNPANRELGAEIARALLKVHYKKLDVDWPGPVLDAAVIDAKSRKRIVAHFAEVKQLTGAEASDFAVLGAEGTVRCTGLKCGATTIALDCERDIALPARLVYGYGNHPKATLVDEAGNRAPAVQQKITTGAVPEDKPTSAGNGAGRVE